MSPKEQVLEVWGELACFSRPEMKVERFSYPIITPSAARGIFDAIYCKPSRDGTKAQFRWQVTRVEVLPWERQVTGMEVLAEPSYIALRRNEVKEKALLGNIADWMSGKSAVQPILADADKIITGTDKKGRTQRQTMALKSVRYRLHAEIRPWPGHEDRVQAFEAQFRRRAARGQCVYQPYFGCREFPAYFELVEPGDARASPVNWDADLGLMLYDVFDLSRPGTATSPAHVSLFCAKVEGGVMEVPDYDNDAVRKAEGGKL
jgi:CRISPR-associated protein Cas5d